MCEEEELDRDGMEISVCCRGEMRVGARDLILESRGVGCCGVLQFRGSNWLGDASKSEASCLKQFLNKIEVLWHESDEFIMRNPPGLRKFIRS